MAFIMGKNGYILCLALIQPISNTSLSAPRRTHTLILALVVKGFFLTAQPYRPTCLRSTSSRPWVICSRLCLRWHLLSTYRREEDQSLCPSNLVMLCTSRWVWQKSHLETPLSKVLCLWPDELRWIWTGIHLGQISILGSKQHRVPWRRL